jgi:hypothetical protein
MSDDAKLSSQSGPSPQPEIHEIPSEAIHRWVAIPDDAPIEVPITRADIDNLYFAIMGLVNAQTSMHTCLVEFSNSNFGNANAALATSKKALVNGTNHISAFMGSVMSKAKGV